MSNEHVPPLPALTITDGTRQTCTQQAIDDWLGKIYAQRPDLFAKIARREGPNPGPEDTYKSEFLSFVRRELKVLDSVTQTRILFEARRRARSMYGLPI